MYTGFGVFGFTLSGARPVSPENNLCGMTCRANKLLTPQSWDRHLKLNFGLNLDLNWETHYFNSHYFFLFFSLKHNNCWTLLAPNPNQLA